MKRLLALAIVTLGCQSEASVDHGTQITIDTSVISVALDAYSARNDGEFPDTLELLTRPDVNGERYLDRESSIDPWGKPYEYATLDDGGYRLATLGRDGAAGGDGPDADFTMESRVAR